MIQHFHRFLSDRGGNIAIIFALALLPLLAAIGAAVDYNRAMNSRQKLSTSLDAALLAFGRSGPEDEDEAQEFVHGYIEQQLLATHYQGSWALDSFEFSGNQITATVSGELPTAIMGLMGVDSIDYGTSSTVIREQKRVELALVLDNTGSMGSSGKIGALRDAASKLVEIMYDGANAEDNVKIALVPFVTSVNIKAPSDFSMDWMDTEGKSKFHGINFDESLTNENYYSGGRRKKKGNKKKSDEPLPANHFDLFDGITNASWKGCVEARPEPYDTNDTAPSSGNPDTLWVPWFWPDEPDSGSSFHNDYMDDLYKGDDDEKQAFTGKYNKHSGSIDETPSNTSGPNKSCGQPILPLTNDEDDLLDDIDDMTPWNGSGTNIAQGLVWGWRVLSPSEPFTEGVPYSQTDTLKALVLLSDGENVVVNQSNSLNYSDYNGYNYLSNDRLGTHSTSQAAKQVNDKVEDICDEVKERDIRVYTILFDLNSSSLRTLFRNCATDPSLYFDNPSPSQLEDVFESIAYDLSNLRLAQ